MHGLLTRTRRLAAVAAMAAAFAVPGAAEAAEGKIHVALGDVPSVGSYYASVENRNFGFDKTDDTVWTLSYRP